MRMIALANRLTYDLVIAYAKLFSINQLNSSLTSEINRVSIWVGASKPTFDPAKSNLLIIIITRGSIFLLLMLVFNIRTVLLNQLTKQSTLAYF